MKISALNAAAFFALTWSGVKPIGAVAAIVTGIHTGQAGTSFVGPTNPTSSSGYSAQEGTDGYASPQVPDAYYDFEGPAIFGGAGGSIIANDPPTALKLTYSAAGGSPGVAIAYGSGSTSPIKVIDGTYVGGAGGNASGTGGTLNAGSGGSGFDIDGGQLTVYSGTFQGGNTGTVSGVYNNEGSGGPAGDGLMIYYGSASILDGVFTGGSGLIAAPGIEMEAGTSNALNIFGGTFNGGGGVNPYFGPYGILNAQGVVNIYGTGFSVNGTPVGGGVVNVESGVITGQLEDNSSVTSTTFSNPNYGTPYGIINLIVVPEPSYLGIVATGLLASGRRNRWSVTASSPA